MNDFDVLLGIELSEMENGIGVYTAEVRTEFLNIHGTVHGGMLFTMLDSAAGAAARSIMQEGKSVMTRCSSVHYLRPVTSGTVTARAEVIKPGQSMVLVDSRLYDADGKLCACGEFEMFVINTMK